MGRDYWVDSNQQMSATETLTLPPWLALAELELGISEIAGPKANKRIVEYHKSTALKAESDEVPWCSALVSFCMKHAGYHSTESAAARSWLNYGEELKSPRFGCIVILKRGTGWMGHVGFYVGETTPDTIRVLGGNQGDKVSIANFPKNQVLGYRWPTKKGAKK